MDANIKAEWVRRLRSGEFQQATGQLRRTEPSFGTSYCCLGILCQQAAEAGEGTWDDDDRFLFSLDHYDNSASVLPTGIVNWAGITAPSDGEWESAPYNPEVPLTDKIRGLLPDTEEAALLKGLSHVSLAGLNDNGFTFAQIADVIEEHL